MIDEALFHIPENKRIIQLFYEHWKQTTTNHYIAEAELAKKFGRDESIHVCPRFEVGYIKDGSYEYAIFYRVWANGPLIVAPTVIIDVEELSVMIVRIIRGYLNKLPNTQALFFVPDTLTEKNIPHFLNKNGSINTQPSFREAVTDCMTKSMSQKG